MTSVWAAYSLVILVIFGYTLNLGRRQQALEEQLADLEKAASRVLQSREN